MKTRLIVYGVTLALVIVALVILRSPAPTTSAQPIRFVITGPEGQRFSGGYIADGLWHVVSAVVPADIRQNAKRVNYAFGPENKKGEVCVALYVNGICKTSVTNSTGTGVVGGWDATTGVERYHAKSSSDLKDSRRPYEALQATAAAPGN